VGISNDQTFTPDTTLHIDGSLKVGRTNSSIGNIYLANKLYDMDNSNYFIDPGAASRVNGLDLDIGSTTTNSVYFSNNTRTGIYQPTIHSIGFSVDGTEAIRITDNRNLELNGNDIRGVEQLHFTNGEVYIDGNNGDIGQVIKSDGDMVYWDDISPIKAESIFETLSGSGGVLWSHPDGIYVYIAPDDKLIRVDNTVSTDNWSVFISGRSTDSSDEIVTISDNISSGNNVELDISGSPCGTEEVWINEIHYDNSGTDTLEGVEIAGVTGTDLSGWTIYSYSGADGLIYSQTSLNGIIPNESNGIGAMWFGILGLQNGSPDGLVLHDGTSVVMFISYEGTFTANDSVAVGMTSTDIGVSQSPNEDIDQTLQLTGSGLSYSDFTWSVQSNRSDGNLNDGQNINTCNRNGGFTIHAGNNTSGIGFTLHCTFTDNTFIGLVQHW